MSVLATIQGWSWWWIIVLPFLAGYAYFPFAVVTLLDGIFKKLVSIDEQLAGIHKTAADRLT